MPDHDSAPSTATDHEIRTRQQRVDALLDDARRQLTAPRAAGDRDRAALDAGQGTTAGLGLTPGEIWDEVGAEDAALLETLRRKVPGATGAARAGVDVADSGTSHLARQIVYAIADGAADDPELRPLLHELAVQSERLSGDAVRLYSRFNDVERSAKALVVADGDADAVADVLVQLHDVHVDGVVIHDAANALRLRLPARYGDPLGLEV